MTEHVEEATAEWLDQPFDPKTADAWDRANCIHHGLLKHSLVHEAGHAVAAARLNIEFVDVSVTPPEERTKVNDGFIGGGLQLVRFEYGWAADRIDDAYEMLLMGVEAVQRMLQDALNGGYLQDVERFKVAGNYLDGVPAADARQLGQRFKAKIDENWPQIEQDIRALVRQSLVPQTIQDIDVAQNDLRIVVEGNSQPPHPLHYLDVGQLVQPRHDLMPSRGTVDLADQVSKVAPYGSRAKSFWPI